MLLGLTPFYAGQSRKAQTSPLRHRPSNQPTNTPQHGFALLLLYVNVVIQNVQQSISPGEEYLLSFQRRRLYYSLPLPPIVRQLPIPSFLSSPLHYALLPLPLFREGEGEGERKQTRNSLSSLSLFLRQRITLNGGGLA